MVHRQISMIDESHRKAVVAIEFMPATLEVRPSLPRVSCDQVTRANTGLRVALKGCFRVYRIARVNMALVARGLLPLVKCLPGDSILQT